LSPHPQPFFLLAGTNLPETINPLALFLMIIAGAGVMCFVTDPYFWLLHRETGDEVKRVFIYYTLPQIVFGFVTCGIALGIQFFFPI
jgi:gluconate:H+ symporter, GntP family